MIRQPNRRWLVDFLHRFDVEVNVIGHVGSRRVFTSPADRSRVEVAGDDLGFERIAHRVVGLLSHANAKGSDGKSDQRSQANSRSLPGAMFRPESGGFDRDRSSTAKRIDQRSPRLPIAEHHHRCRQRLLDLRMRAGDVVAASIQSWPVVSMVRVARSLTIVKSIRYKWSCFGQAGRLMIAHHGVDNRSFDRSLARRHARKCRSDAAAGDREFAGLGNPSSPLGSPRRFKQCFEIAGIEAAMRIITRSAVRSQRLVWQIVSREPRKPTRPGSSTDASIPSDSSSRRTNVSSPSAQTAIRS